MPIYEYQRADGSIFELIQKITEEPLEQCPTTGQSVQRIISQNAFHLKGGGWYKTDYAGKSNSNAGKTTKSDSSSNSSNEGAPSASSDQASSADTSKACSTGCGCH